MKRLLDNFGLVVAPAPPLHRHRRQSSWSILSSQSTQTRQTSQTSLLSPSSPSSQVISQSVSKVSQVSPSIYHSHSQSVSRISRISRISRGSQSVRQSFSMSVKFSQVSQSVCQRNQRVTSSVQEFSHGARELSFSMRLSEAKIHSSLDGSPKYRWALLPPPAPPSSRLPSPPAA